MAAPDSVRPGNWTAKAREMVRHNREEIGDGCAYSVYADRLLDACDEMDRLKRVEDAALYLCAEIHNRALPETIEKAVGYVEGALAGKLPPPEAALKEEAP